MIDVSRDALTRFVRGEWSLAELRDELQGSVTIDFENPATRIIRVAPGAPLATVEFNRSDIGNAIRRFLSFEGESQNLSNWAAVIRMLDSHFTLDPRDQNPDAVWSAIDDLVAVGVTGELDRQAAEDLLRSLELEP